MIDLQERTTVDTEHQRARRRVEELRGFYFHLAVYVLVNAFLVFQDLIAGDGLDWAYWTFIPWGIGLVMHSLAVFVWSDDWAERKADQIARR